MEDLDHGSVEFSSSTSVDASKDLFCGGAFDDGLPMDDVHFPLPRSTTNETLGMFGEPGPSDEESMAKPPVKQRKAWNLVAVIALMIGIAVSTCVLVLIFTDNNDESTLSDADKLTKDDPKMSSDPMEPSVSPTLQDHNPLNIPPPSLSPTTLHPPSLPPFRMTSKEPLASPTSRPSATPHGSTLQLSSSPSKIKTNIPSTWPTRGPSSIAPTFISYVPGLLVPSAHGLKLSQGLTVRVLATTGQPVKYDNGGISSDVFHVQPDFGATFEDPRPWNAGGWIYVNNAENRTHYDGGVGALTFDLNGQLIDYRMVLNNTRANCGGGKTEWGAWISCEEFSRGRNWQVDPTGERPAQVISLGSDGGQFESFAFDTRNRSTPIFFVTEDILDGALQRWRPFAPDWSDPWSILLGQGETDFLVLHPDADGTTGTYEWTQNRTLAELNAESYYPNTEGIEVHQNKLMFISKRLKQIFTLDLDGTFYRSDSTRSGLFNGGPDQIKQIIGKQQELLYFTEDSNGRAGIHARDSLARFYTVLETEVYQSETTGLAFSPDHKAMIFAYQDDGLLFEARRLDGLPFGGMTLNVQFHNS